VNTQIFNYDLIKLVRKYYIYITKQDTILTAKYFQHILGGDDRAHGYYQVRSSGISLRLRSRHH